jgi:hypothetical protein
MKLSEVYGKNFKRSLLVAGVIGASVALLTDEPKSKTQHPPRPVPKAESAAKPHKQRHEKLGEAYVALHDYSTRFNLQHRAAIAMNSCVAWGDQNGGVAVTYNPGVVSLHGDHSFLQYLVFGEKVEKVGQTDRLVVANGPLAITTGGQTYDQTKKDTLQIYSGDGSGGNIWSRVSERLVSADPVPDSSSSGPYYTDVDTGQPVIRTELVSGSLDISTVAPVCVALANGAIQPSFP